MKRLILSCVVMFSALIVLDARAEKPPVKPQLRSPGKNKEPGEEIKDFTPTFTWRAVEGTTRYEFWLEYADNGVLVHKYLRVLKNSCKLPPRRLTAGRPYRWRVRAFRNAEASEFSDYLYFHTSETIDVPRLRSPGKSREPGREINDLTPTFTWRAVEGADMYRLYIHEAPYGQENLVYQKFFTANAKKVSIRRGKLKPGGKYRWSMRAYRRTIATDFSKPLYFTISTTIEAPRLRGPGRKSERGREIKELQPTFRWRAVEGADMYAIYVSEAPYGSANLVYQKLFWANTTEMKISRGKLEPGKRYRWNMRAYRSEKPSEFSEHLYFYTAGADAGDEKSDAGPIQLQWPMSGTITRVMTGGHRGIDIATNDVNEKDHEDKLPRVRIRERDGTRGYLEDSRKKDWAAKNEDGAHVFYSGAPVYAAAPGRVEHVGSHKQFGRYIVIEHDDGYKTLYAHLYDISVRWNDKVRAGKRIGVEGNTGDVEFSPELFTEGEYKGKHRKPGLHLHFVLFRESKDKSNNIPEPGEIISLPVYKAKQTVEKKTPIKGWTIPASR